MNEVCLEVPSKAEERDTHENMGSVPLPSLNPETLAALFLFQNLFVLSPPYQDNILNLSSLLVVHFYIIVEETYI